MEPYLFEPVFIEKIWGGRNLARVLGKSLPEGVKIGESFEISRRPGEESIVAAGREKGLSLRELIERSPAGILGRAILEKYAGRFPLLLKFLDAEDTLSVQVHPTDSYARARGLDDTGKEETWYVIEARADARLIKGLRPGTTRKDFEALLREGRLGECLNSFPARAGDVVHLPAGTVHAIGAGLVLAEIQRNSNVTYRVFDWNRLGPEGTPRELHIDDALAVIDWNARLPDKSAPLVVEESPALRRRLVRGDYYEIESYRGRQPFPVPRIRETFRMLIVISGSGRLRHRAGELPYDVGESYLLPAALNEITLAPAADTLILVVAPR